jgi:hypothetical protein
MCLTATCDQWENGKSISSTDSAQTTIAHRADPDSDLARPPGGDHRSARAQAWVLAPVALHAGAPPSGQVVARPSPADSE